MSEAQEFERERRYRPVEAEKQAADRRSEWLVHAAAADPAAMRRLDTATRSGVVGELHGRAGNGAVQRVLADVQREGETPHPPEEEEEQPPVQPRREGEATIGSQGGPLTSDVASRIDGVRGGGTPLDSGTRANMEDAMGTSFEDVRVHTDAASDSLNRSMSATAFTTGSDVFFRQGAYRPGTPDGDHVIGHELAHVVQQRSMPADTGPMTVGAADDPHEHEADRVADAAVARKTGDGEDQC